MSLFLNGVQIIEKQEYEGGNGTGGFEATEGFDGSNFEPPTPEVAEVEDAEMDEIPF